MMSWRLGIAVVLLAALSPLVAMAGQGSSTLSGFRALTGAEADGFVVPADMRLETSIELKAYGLTYERYQQHFGVAEVLGAQLTLYRDSSGITAAIGSHYPDIAATGAVSLSGAAVERIVERDVGPADQRIVDLMIDPESGRYFFRVESRGFASRWFHWIDAASGQLLNRYNAIETGEGIGVKGDTKDLTDLTTFHSESGHGGGSPHFDLFSADDRQRTFDYRNKDPFIYFVTDSDDVWDLVTGNRKSPGQPALVDAHYYANLTDDYLQGVHGLDWIADCGYTAMQSVAHYERDYNNAFWNGTYTVYGDGDGVVFRELSGALDVVAHEHAHGVTDCTSDLIYLNQPGALNESFSDILGNSAEFFANEPDSSNCVKAQGQTECADWWIGEDIRLLSDAVPGFRNMADPGEDADPDHYGEFIVTTDDNGGVHSNSGIPNHAYYLLVNGGQNAGCDDVGSNGHTHTADCDVTVSGIGLADAERIFFLGFTALPSNAIMCDAREATEAAASVLSGPGSQQAQSTTDAWLAVGLTDVACGLATPTPTPAPTPTPTPPPDSDGDGVLDDRDPDDDGDGFSDSDETDKGSDPLSASSTPEHCDGLDNDGDTEVDEVPTGADWDIDGDTVKDCLDSGVDTDGDGQVNTLDNDDDGDGVPDVRERGMSTDELGSCSTSFSHDASPTDFDKDGDADSGDVLGLFFFSINQQAGELFYSVRSDFDGDGDNDLGDLLGAFFFFFDTKCAELTFTNSTGGEVDDIHIEWSAAIAEVFSALDSDLGSWSDRTLSGDGLTLDVARPVGVLADGGQLTIVVRGSNPTISSCQWTLDGVDQGAC